MIWIKSETRWRFQDASFVAAVLLVCRRLQLAKQPNKRPLNRQELSSRCVSLLPLSPPRFISTRSVSEGRCKVAEADATLGGCLFFFLFLQTEIFLPLTFRERLSLRFLCSLKKSYYARPLLLLLLIQVLAVLRLLVIMIIHGIIKGLAKVPDKFTPAVSDLISDFKVTPLSR